MTKDEIETLMFLKWASFIFQIHNREDTVKEMLIPFINAQNNGMNSQLIVCNDGSTDKSASIVTEIKDLRIVIITSKLYK